MDDSSQRFSLCHRNLSRKYETKSMTQTCLFFIVSSFCPNRTRAHKPVRTNTIMTTIVTLSLGRQVFVEDSLRQIIL